MRDLKKIFTLLIIAVVLISAMFLVSCFDKEDGEIKVTFIVDGGEYKTIKIGQEELLLPQTPQKIGYDFDGWYFKDSNEKFDINQEITKSVEIEARWIAKQITITLDDGEGFCKSIKASYGSTYGELDIPTKPGCTFDAWYSNSRRIEPDAKILFLEDIVLQPRWIPNSYKLSFETNIPDRTIDPIIVTYNSTYTNFPPLNKNGYTYKWFINGEEIREGDVVKITEDSTICAEWTIVKYKVSFKSMGVTLPQSAEVIYGETYSGKLFTPTREGYEFDTWLLNGYRIDENTIVNTPHSHTLQAQWTPLQYTVTYDAKGGVIEQTTQQVTYDEDVTLPSPTMEGNSFAGWYDGSTLFKNGTWQTAKNVTLTAKWAAVENATFDSLGRVESFVFGEYPQTIANNVEFTGEIDSRGYYKGTDNLYYAKVTMPLEYNYNYTFSDRTQIKYNKTYYFKVEPIVWRVKYKQDGSYAIMSDLILDCKKYCISQGEREGAVDYQNNSTNETVYKNNYKYSDIRTFINTTFLDNAFTEAEKARIKKVIVDNSPSSTGHNENSYACENTEDKIYLLSISDIEECDFSDYLDKTTIGTDYAKANGLYVYTREDEYVGKSKWFLRSPSQIHGNAVMSIDFMGRQERVMPSEKSCGLRPSFCIDFFIDQ